MSGRGRFAFRGASLFTISIIAIVAWGVVSPDSVLDVGRWLQSIKHGAERGRLDLHDGSIAWTRLEPATAVKFRGEVIIVHGLRGDASVGLPLASALKGRGYRVTLVDLPGHGSSSLGTAPLEIDRASHLISQAIGAWGLETPIVVGHSMGAWITAWLAVSDPESIGGAVLISPPGMPSQLPPLPRLLARTAGDARVSMGWLFDEPPWVPTPALWLAAQRDDRGSLDLMRSGASGRFRMDEVAAAIDVPALILTAEGDAIVDPSSARAYVELIEDAKLEVFEGSSHMLPWEYPQRCADAIAEQF